MSLLLICHVYVMFVAQSDGHWGSYFHSKNLESYLKIVCDSGLIYNLVFRVTEAY
jgi:hypothetical protein